MLVIIVDDHYVASILRALFCLDIFQGKISEQKIIAYNCSSNFFKNRNFSCNSCDYFYIFIFVNNSNFVIFLSWSFYVTFSVFFMFKLFLSDPKSECSIKMFSFD